MSLNGTRIRELDLPEILEGIHAGTVALPNFQRKFEWSDGEIRALMGTVLSGWPMGSLLTIRADESARGFYQPRAFEFAPPLADDLELIVLDGQQRLTALYQVFYGRGPSRFAVRMTEGFTTGDIDAIDAAIRSFKVKQWSRFYAETETQWEHRMVPASKLRDASDFFEWRDEVTQGQTDLELTAVYRNHFSGLTRYRIPTVEVGSELPPAAVARIFERVNRGGRRLSTFDLMVAKSFTRRFNLRDRWLALKEERPAVFEYCDDGMPLLSVLSLLSERNDIRASAVLELSGEDIRTQFDDAVDYLDKAILFAKQRLGVMSAGWMPYSNMLVVLAGLAAKIDLEEHSALIERWFWDTSFGLRYAVASNTEAVADFNALKNNEMPKRRSLVLVWSDLEESTRQHSGALHRSILCWLSEELSTAGELTAASRVSAHTIYRADDSDSMDPPLHLRSMGFALYAQGDETPIASTVQALPNMDREIVLWDDVLRNRRSVLKRFLVNRIGADVVIADSGEALEDGTAGLE